MLKLLKRYRLIAQLSATSAFDGGLVYILSGYILKLIRLIVLLLVWRSLLTVQTAAAEMQLEAVLTYTFLASILSEQLNVITPATMAFWEGALTSRYLKPLPVLGQLTAETFGRWLPALLLYSCPMLLIAPLLKVNLYPSTPLSGFLAGLSLLLAVSLGFALDYLFAAVVIYIQNANWTALMIRQAINAVFSGALIPFALYPWGIGEILQFLPWGSVAGAPLAIYTGNQAVKPLLIAQVIWNLLLWTLAVKAFQKSQERLVSYGG